MSDDVASWKAEYGWIAVAAFAWGLAIPFVAFSEYLHPKYVAWVVGVAVVVTVSALAFVLLGRFRREGNEVTA